MQPLQYLLMLMTLSLTACAAPNNTPDVASSAAIQAPADATASTGTEIISCADAPGYIAPTDIMIEAKPVPLWPEGKTGALPPNVNFSGGWELTSPNSGFGGLSGIEVLPNGNLLTVSDDGAFVWIEMRQGVPSGSGQIAFMRGANGTYLHGKTEADAEGLSLADGLAYVSFERQHRIEAFDLDKCGAASRAKLITALADTIEGTAIPSNRGPEALASEGNLIAGYEQLVDGKSPIVTRHVSGTVISLLPALADKFDGPLTGMTNPTPIGEDSNAGTVSYFLRRRYNPILGNLITVEARSADASHGHNSGAAEALFKLSRPMNVDNFEGITSKTLNPGTHRLWLISDDNFSDRQRTLLFVFDVDLTAGDRRSEQPAD